MTATDLLAPDIDVQADRAFRESLKQTEDWKAGEHDLNVASLADLNSLKGGGMIGRAIIAGRPYRTSDELVTRRILSRATYERIKAQVSARTPSGQIDSGSIVSGPARD